MGGEINHEERFVENDLFDPHTFFEDVVGVTKNEKMMAQTVRFWVNRENAPYVATMPFHKSQVLVEKRKDGSKVFEINVVINQELQREFLGFADAIKILRPASLVDFMARKFCAACFRYADNKA